MNLTTPDFWDHYWSSLKLPTQIDPALSFERCLSRGLREALRGKSGDLLEIGCAPGKWLAHLARELGLKPSGIEYSSTGAIATRRNLEMLGVEVGDLMNGDFFKIEPAPRFDVVMSLGFIEHFDEPVSVIQRHVAWLKPGGTLILGVPNFRGIHWILQKMMDPKVLDLHNLSVMRREFFESLVQSCGLEVESIEYLGSLEPSLPMQSVPSNRPIPALAKVITRLLVPFRRTPLLDSFNHRLSSSYLLGVLRRQP